MFEISRGGGFNSNEDTQGLFSPGSLQQSSQALVGESSCCWIHWHDSKPYATHIDPVHSWKQWVYVWLFEKKQVPLGSRQILHCRLFYLVLAETLDNESPVHCNSFDLCTHCHLCIAFRYYMNNLCCSKDPLRDCTVLQASGCMEAVYLNIWFFVASNSLQGNLLPSRSHILLHLRQHHFHK